MKMIEWICLLIVFLFISFMGCANKNVEPIITENRTVKVEPKQVEIEKEKKIERLIPKPVISLSKEQLEAMKIMNLADKEIRKAENSGIFLSKAYDEYFNAQKTYSEKEFIMAIRHAQAAYDLAVRATSYSWGKLEPQKKKCDWYVVGTWKADRACLWNISGEKKIYGNPWLWKRIYDANRDKIKHPDKIYPQQILNIPRD